MRTGILQEPGASTIIYPHDVAAGFFSLSVSNDQTTRHHIPEDSSNHTAVRISNFVTEFLSFLCKYVRPDYQSERNWPI
jgi:hypothetical protein